MRGKKAKTRKIDPDPKYGSIVIAKFINYIMLHGKKSIARKTVYEALDDSAKKLKQKDATKVLSGALENVMPSVEVRSRRVGGANYQVPMPVPENRRVTLGLKWIINAARKRSGKDFTSLLSNELVNAFKGEGDAVRIKTETEKMAEANKAFAHFRW